MGWEGILTETRAEKNGFEKSLKIRAGVVTNQESFCIANRAEVITKWDKFFIAITSGIENWRNLINCWVP